MHPLFSLATGRRKAQVEDIRLTRKLAWEGLSPFVLRLETSLVIWRAWWWSMWWKGQRFPPFSIWIQFWIINQLNLLQCRKLSTGGTAFWFDYMVRGWMWMLKVCNRERFGTQKQLKFQFLHNWWRMRTGLIDGELIWREVLCIGEASAVVMRYKFWLCFVEWFEGLSDLFLSLSIGKLLILAGRDSEGCCYMTKSVCFRRIWSIGYCVDAWTDARKLWITFAVWKWSCHSRRLPRKTICGFGGIFGAVLLHKCQCRRKLKWK